MPGVYEIYVQKHFSAAHSLSGYPGDCARIHGHNWIIDVFVRCRELDEIGIGLDFREIKRAIKEVLDGLDHYNLNETPYFADVNPTSENIAKHLYKEIGNRINSDRVGISKIKVSETPGAGAFYWEE